jgi:hypothetical protein
VTLGEPEEEAKAPSTTTTIAKESGEPAPALRSSGLGPGRALGWLFVFGLVFAGILVGVLSYQLLAPSSPADDTEEVLRETPDVITAVRDLARLETASYHLERVIDLRDRQQVFFGLTQAEDGILLVAAADVTAGVDLTKMRDGDVVVDPDARIATITLPEPEIFSAALDNDNTYVHTRDTDTLARRDPHLETRARREAERNLRDSAIEGGILERARGNAETSVSTLVRSLGYDTIQIRWRAPTDER